MIRTASTRQPFRGRRLLGAAVLVVVADQATKAIAQAIVGPVDPTGTVPASVVLLGGLIELAPAANSGLAGGGIRNSALVFAALSIVPLILATLAGRRLSSPPPSWLAGATGLVVGGALGNLIDRVRLGYVVDFAQLNIGPLANYLFNVADVALLIGLVVLVIRARAIRRLVRS